MRGALKCIVAIASALACALGTLAAQAAGYPVPQEGSWTARDFRFHSGEVMPELRLHYRTIGAPTGEPVLVLHGTASSGAAMLTPAFAGELFGPGQPFDASRYYIIIPDTLGHGKSSKPSDGLRMKFPRYDYDDMVGAHYRLLTEHLKVKHLRAVIGNSMGGMETWIFAEKYPGYMDIAVPMACLPPFWRSMPPTTSAILPSSDCSIARSSGSGMAGCCSFRRARAPRATAPPAWRSSTDASSPLCCSRRRSSPPDADNPSQESAHDPAAAS
ncbi:MAG TPA: alpha/beta fold hydrolase [Casimicrobiaceae bacterium]|nr:alpha/beta fold hydrolase [Casimicrobiaceae bacterium]